LMASRRRALASSSQRGAEVAGDGTSQPFVADLPRSRSDCGNCDKLSCSFGKVRVI
jgi:hypothetical protein